ncbi:MAG: type VI secretion system baseplate subunit TssG [Myxococcales bacterium]|nr:type VI secretion system baseplate subunit TssG [Myxococcales bacterium]MCB9717383.1 type VI secretion system baseplate subunit TssG [Myxococcales bacterium]
MSPPRTDFFTAVMQLERLTRDHERIGGTASLTAEAISFRHDISFGFQPNDISSIQWIDVDPEPDRRLEGRRGHFEIVTCVLGLSGADSPLPLYHVEDLVLDDEEARVQAAFLDLFHNRITALLYRACTKYSPPREYLRGGRDPFSLRLLAAAGVDRGGDDEPVAPRRAELLGLAALLATGGGTGRSIENALRCLLSRELSGTNLDFDQFRGSWIEFDPDQRTSLGKSNSSMAIDWILGTRVRHPAHRARVVVGPMAPERAREFAPGGKSFQRMNDLVHALCTEPIAIDLELLIDQDAYPPFFLRVRDPRVLGENVFLSSRKRGGRVMKRLFPLDEGKEAPGPAPRR